MFWPTSFCDSVAEVSQPYDALLTSCCPDGCRLIDPQTDRYCYYCDPVTRAVGVSCIYEEDGICATVKGNSQLCTDGVYCPFDDIYTCGFVPPSPTPTPTPDFSTPTPTPEPTCDPATKPNNTNCICTQSPVIGGQPFWYCGIGCNGATGADYTKPEYSSNRGCPSNKYNDGDCCRCLVSTCGDGQPVDPSNCECPSPSPTPTNGGGGPGDPSPYAPMDHVDCVDYYWVHFVSYDGGQTWNYDDRESYAGCFYEY